MDRSPLVLAALASAAVPGLDPASVEALPGSPDSANRFDVAFVQDTQHRRWVVRVPRSQAAAAQMESTVALLALLARRLPFSVPTPKGFAGLQEGGRAAIYPFLPGRTVDFARLPAGPGLAAELGRAIAALHNADHQLFEEAGLPAYDADTYRTRRLSELDRAAETGHVPARLLSRWEKQLEDVSLWRFAPTPTHGDLTGDQVLVVFDDEDDAATGRVKAFTGWEDAKLADPADDFAELVLRAPPEAVETLMEAYAHARAERPDAHLLTRARLRGEMGVLSALMTAVSAGNRLLVERYAVALRRLDERVAAQEEAQDDYRRTAERPVRAGSSPVLVPDVVEDDVDDDVDDDEDLEDEYLEDRRRPEADPDREQGGAEVDEGFDEEVDGRTDQQTVEDERQADVALMFGPTAVTSDDDEHDAEDDSGHDADGDDHEVEGTGEDDAGSGTARDEVTAEIDVSAVRAAPAGDDGDDPGPEFEPGWTPPHR